MLVQSSPSSDNIDASRTRQSSWHPPRWTKGSCAWYETVPKQLIEIKSWSKSSDASLYTVSTRGETNQRPKGTSIAIQYQNEISSMCTFLTLQPELLGNELKLYSYLVSVSTCKYSIYTCHTACGFQGASPLCKISTFTVSACISAASQRFPNKLKKESGTFTSGLLGPGPWANFSG